MRTGDARGAQDRQLIAQCGPAQNNQEVDRQWFEYDSGATVYNTTENIDVRPLEPVSLYVSLATSLIASLRA